MRYCTNCGHNIENSRFCDKCGTDNGEPVAVKQEHQKSDLKFNKSSVLHWCSVICFAITALILLIGSCQNAKISSVYSYLYAGNCIFAILFFAYGMWSCIPTILFILNGKNGSIKTVVGTSVIVLLLTIVVLILSFASKYIGGFMSAFPLVFAPYKAEISKVIVFSVFAIAAGIAETRIKQ